MKFIGKKRFRRVKKKIVIAGINLTNQLRKPRKLNIGSGRRSWLGWICLDEIEHPNVQTVRFSKETSFPVKSNSIKLAYSSHALEHLEDDVVHQVLKEAYRCLAPNGVLVLKLPDFEWFLEQYRAQNKSFMNGKGIESITWTWKSYEVEDTVENRVAMMFCGYWNRQYGEHFKREILNTTKAYHGPPKVESDELEQLLSVGTPREITRKLKNIVAKDPDFHAFNHCNSWTVDDLQNLLRTCGFEILETNRTEVFKKYHSVIPDLESMLDWSITITSVKI